jgi:hypothetical protein
MHVHTNHIYMYVCTYNVYMLPMHVPTIYTCYVCMYQQYLHDTYVFTYNIYMLCMYIHMFSVFGIRKKERSLKMITLASLRFFN